MPTPQAQIQPQLKLQQLGSLLLLGFAIAAEQVGARRHDQGPRVASFRQQEPHAGQKLRIVKGARIFEREPPSLLLFAGHLAVAGHSPGNRTSSSMNYYIRGASRAVSRAMQRIDAWRRCVGLCCVCGQPIASPRLRATVALLPPPSKGGAETFAAIDSDARLLTEETPVRMALLRFNALAEFQAAHILDDYTFLANRRGNSGGSVTPFRKAFVEQFAAIHAANPEALQLFKERVIDAPDPRILDMAIATQRRAAENLTFPSCHRCNRAMSREHAHTLAVYRCFPITCNSDVPLLEGNDNKALAARKVLQQIALYFRPVSSSDKRRNLVDWTSKPEDQILADGTLWRCIAHLTGWGASPPGGGARLRMIATFHAAHYLYLHSTLRGALSFESWHVHVFRPYLMRTFETPNTFFGLRQTEVAAVFDLSRKDGAVWERILHKRLAAVGLAMESQDRKAEDEPALLGRILQFEDQLAGAGVADEDALLQRMARMHGGMRPATHALLAFFRYNLAGGHSADFFLHQLASLETAMVRAASAVLKHQEVEPR